MRSSSNTLNEAPSLVNSKSQISIGSASSHSSQKSIASKISQKSDVPLTREEIIQQYLDKAKWYTSVCLGKFKKILENLISLT